MHHYTLTTLETANAQPTILYQGRFHSFTACLERAIKDNAPLHNIDLQHKNLSNANLDGAVMAGAAFTGVNLTGANMSECHLKGARFDGAALYNTYFCDSNLSECNFRDASFGATDIHGAILCHAQFSTLSCFSLDFTHARAMTGCRFINPDGLECAMSRPPVVVRGWGSEPLVFFDHAVKSGHNLLDHPRLRRVARMLERSRRLSA